jgi:hypothetical protein
MAAPLRHSASKTRVNTLMVPTCGSWKAKVQRTPDERLMHGKFGEGRFRAFALGGIVTWDSTFRDMIKVGRRKHPRNEADSCPLVNRIITSPPRLLPTNLLFYKALLPR